MELFRAMRKERKNVDLNIGIPKKRGFRKDWKQWQDFDLDDTIAAVSTAMAPAGIGIVRISGNDAFEVADRVFRAKKRRKNSFLRSNRTPFIMAGLPKGRK